LEASKIEKESSRLGKLRLEEENDILILHPNPNPTSNLYPDPDFTSMGGIEDLSRRGK